MSFTHEVRVRYGEVDAQQVVFNAHWLAYIDDALTQYLAHLGFDPKTTFLDEGSGFDVMLVKATLEWKGPAGFDDLVRIAVRPTRLGGASFDLTYTCEVEGRPALEAVVTYVSVVPGENRSQPIPDPVRHALEADADA